MEFYQFEKIQKLIMPVEIERKYLLDHEKWHKSTKPKGQYIRQGYLVAERDKTIRVRIAGEKAYLTIKGRSVGASVPEYEYEIPNQEAEELLAQFALSDIEKTRYKYLFQGKIWEIDEFLGENEGLIVAEIELVSEDEYFEIPDFIKNEVTGEKKYYNANLSKMPYKKW